MFTFTDEEIIEACSNERVAESIMFENILAIELVDRQHTPEQAKRVLTDIFCMSSDDADLHLNRFLYADET